jgi:hypothetical protein
MKFKVGDKVKLIDGCPYAGLRMGEVGVVTRVDDKGFYINHHKDCCSPRYWVLVEEAQPEPSASPIHPFWESA